MDDPNKGADNTAGQAGQADGTKDEIVQISKTELEKLNKKASDFDGIAEKLRIEKLQARTAPKTDALNGANEDAAAIAKKAAEEAVAEILRKEGTSRFQESLTSAYKEFVEAHPWANDDTIMAEISDSFDPGKAFTKDDLLKKMEATALSLHPQKFREHIEAQTKARIQAEMHQAAVGGAGGASSVPSMSQDNSVQSTDEDRRIADRFFGGDISRYLKHKAKS
jgi:hypothetical protein